jgi:cytochrome P450
VTKIEPAHVLLNQLVYDLYLMAQSAQPKVLGSALVVSQADLFHQVVASPEVYIKDYSLLTYFGRSRFDTNGTDWQARRALSQPNYLSAAKPHRIERIKEVFATAFDNPDDATPDTIQRTLFGASLRLFFEAFDCAVDVRPLLPIVDEIREVFAHLQSLAWIGGSDAAKALGRAEADRVRSSFKAACREQSQLDSLLDRLQAAGPDDDGFDATSELAINMFAGIETTTAAISWVIDRLGCNPQVQERVHRDLMVNGDTLYLEAFIFETLRFFPPIPFITRRVSQHAKLAGRDLPAGQLIFLSVVGLHQSGEAWNEPNTFKAARTEFITGNYHRRAFAPFLSGPRVCGGMKLAKLEMSAALSCFIRRYHVERRGEDVRLDYALAMRPNSWSSINILERQRS